MIVLTTCAEVIATSDAGFGTSGVRGLVEALDDAACFAYTSAFLDHLSKHHGLAPGSKIWFGHDLRPSSPRIAAACMAAASHNGYQVRNCGEIPTPALAFSALVENSPAIMITGSHIPFDRNGIKFYRADGELMKEDEAPLLQSSKPFPSDQFDNGSLINSPSRFPIDSSAAKKWIDRYKAAFGKILDGMLIGHYQHSAAGRDLHCELMAVLGARVVALGRSEEFVPIDTEAVSESDCEMAHGWAKEHNLDAIFSTDGDGDRPLLADEKGDYFRGDTLGILAATSLNANHVVTPVSSNTALEKSERFQSIDRTKIGSPHVIAAMNSAVQAGKSNIVGFEANGGFLTSTSIDTQELNQSLAALPTRDSILPVLATIALSKRLGVTLSALRSTLPERFTASGRLQNTPTEISTVLLQSLTDTPELAVDLMGKGVPVKDTNQVDGLRITFENDEIIHLRPSGNAPELRVYVESDSSQQADAILNRVVERLSETL